MLFGIFWQNFMEYGNKGLVMDIEESGKKVEKLYYFECGSFIPHRTPIGVLSGYV